MIRIILRKIKRLLDKTFGTIIEEWFWSLRSKAWAKFQTPQENLNDPLKRLLVEHITEYTPFNSVLEVGCAAGLNLYLLAKKFPETKFYGIDINRHAIRLGQEYFREHNVNSIFLSVKKAEDLSSFPDKSIDIIFTDAVLMLISPDKIERVLEQFFRVGRKALIFIEWHQEKSEISIYNDHWVHNYAALSRKYIPEQIEFIKITPDLRSGDWAKDGYIIKITI